jgi:hypothetical protein
MGYVHFRAYWEVYEACEEWERLELEHEAVEGCTLEDVGWMMVPIEDVRFHWCYLRRR